MKMQMSLEVFVSLLLAMLIALSIASMTAASMRGQLPSMNRIYENANLTIARMEGLCGCSMVK